MSEMPDYEYEFDPDAENNTAAAIFRLAARGGQRILDLGSGPGIVAGALSKMEGKEVTCVDVEPEYLEAAQARGVASIIQADLDDASWATSLRGESYDVIVLADVLEHLVQPGDVLEVIRQEGLLAEDGYLVVSIPNVAHEAVIASLIAGRFEYTPTGLLDSTHLRFFTRDSFQLFCERHGFVITALERTLRTIEQTELFSAAEALAPGLRSKLERIGQDSRTYQFIMRVEPLDAAHELARLRSQVQDEIEQRIRATEDMRRELKEATTESAAKVEAATQRSERLRRERDELIGRLSRDLNELRAQKERELTTLAQIRDDERGELERLREQLRHTEMERRDLQRRFDEQFEARETFYRETRRLEQKLEDLQASETWRAGRALLWLPRMTARAFRRRSSKEGETDESTGGGRARRRPPAHLLPEYALTEDTDARVRYQRALSRRRFTTDGPSVVMAVSTTDLDSGRGDIYTAVGLGNELERLGYEVIYLAEQNWYEVPDGSDIYLALLAEPRAMLDPLRIPPSCRLVGWVRNNTDRWVNTPALSMYDALLCSSETSLRAIERVYNGPTGVLRIGVDADLFVRDDATDRRGVLTTINYWGGRRRMTYEALVEYGVDFPLAIYGVQRDRAAELEPFSRGTASYFALPSLYSQAELVLDDQQHVNRPFGNVNSRIYESLAAGALPITNSGLGLREVGLEQTPVYHDAQELGARVHDILADSQGRRDLVGRLRDVVLSNHTYAIRAEQFDAFMRTNGVVDGTADRRAKVLGFMPDYRSTNPYQRLLYARLSELSTSAVPVDGPSDLMSAPRVPDDAAIFHLHWTATILGPSTDREDARHRSGRFLAELDSFKDGGGKVIWTVHNAMPHECRFPDLESELRQGIADRADVVHVMCAETPALVATSYTLPEERIVVVPHGSYVDAYPDVVGQDEAREELGLGNDDFVYLFLGQIRPYKGLDDLLDAFDIVASKEPSSRLVVAGDPGRFDGVNEVLGRCESHPRILTRPEAVPDVDLQLYLKAADVVVLPHRRTLNSGLVPLAFAFGRPVVAPKAGCVAAQVRPGTGLTFDQETDDLAEVLLAARQLRDDGFRRAAFDVATAYTHRDMADGFAELVMQLLD